MEKRLIAAIVLSFLVLVLYQVLFVKQKPQPVAEPRQYVQGEKQAGQPVPEKTPSEAKVTGLPEVSGVAPQPAEVIRADRPDENILIETSLYRAEWSNKGGVLKNWKLKGHFKKLPTRNENTEEPLDLVSEASAKLGRYPFALSFDDAALTDALNSEFYRVTSPSGILEDGRKAELRFEYSDGREIRVEKVFVFTGGSYDLGCEIRVWRGGQEIEPTVLWGPGVATFSPEEQKQRFSAATGAAVLTGGKVYRIDEKKYKPEQAAFNFVEWAAYENSYFAALFVLNPQKGTAVFRRELVENIPYFYLAVSRPERAFLGPKELDALRAYGHNAKKVINFGMFGSIAEILLVSIKYFHKFIPNWGAAIVILTIIIKIIFFPLTYSSTKSMAKMQELQPKIKALRAKYKKAKQDISQRRQMNEEMMQLYKQHGVNPAGGCLPMLIQIPVFWGVFRMLVVAVEFRHSPFAFWIKDLSVKDPTYITPILMGATQFISQKMTPTSADPSQARMMLIMPVIMTFIFLQFQSGLILYWLTTNVLQIAQQAVMNRMIAKKKRESDGKRR